MSSNIKLGQTAILASLVITTILGTSGCSSAPTPVPISVSHEQAIADAYEALYGLDLAEASDLFAQIAASATDPSERATAQLEWGRMMWRFYGQPEEARRILLEGAEQSTREAEFLLELSRLEIEEGRFDAARDAAERALQRADAAEVENQANEDYGDFLQWMLSEPDTVKRARIHLAWATVEEATGARLGTDQSASAGGSLPHPDLLQEALDSLKDIVQTAPGELHTSRLLLSAALMLDDGDNALRAWRSYYHAAPAGETFALLSQPYAVLKEILPRWQGSTLSAADRERLIDALADSGFHVEAALVALDPRAAGEMSARAEQVVAYARFIRSMRPIEDEHYRQMILRERGTTTWQEQILQETDPLCALLGCSGEPLDSVFELIEERFGALILFGANDSELIFGHLVADEDRQVGAGNHAATVRFVIIDGMVCGDLTTWALEQLLGRETGIGWADEGMIGLIRPGTASAGAYFLQWLADPERRAALEARVARESLADEARAAEDPFSYLPGLSGRFALRTFDLILNDLRAQGIEGAELHSRFVAEVEEELDRSLLAHEGRHVIDIELGFSNPGELEFYAKLAQIANAQYPGLLLIKSIIIPDLGQAGGGHTEGNRRFLQGITAWMEEHAAEIEGLDISQPLLPQLDRLSDDQIRAAARSMDPLVSSE